MKKPEFFFFLVFLFLIAFNSNLVGDSAIHKLHDKVAIDGILDDWQGHPFEILGAGYPYEKSFSAIFYQGWSRNGLAFAAEVYDDIVFNNGSDDDDYRNQDCLELFLDLRGLDQGNKNPMSRKNKLAIDFFRIEESSGNWLYIDNSDQKISYSDDEWQLRKLDGCYNNSIHWLGNGSKAWVELEFVGKRIQLGAIKYRIGGIYDVIIDGKKVARIDFFSLRQEDSSVCFDSGELVAGRHSIRLQEFIPRQDGILHMLINPNSLGSGSVHCYDNNGISSVVNNVVTTSNLEGWTVEGIIPWSFFDPFHPKENQTLRFGYKFYDRDNLSEKDLRVLGLERQGSETSVEWIAMNPDRFPKYTLKGTKPFTLMDPWVSETLHQGKPWLEVDLKIPAKFIENETSNGPMVELLNSHGKIHNLAMSLSLSKKFWIAKELLPIEFFSDDGKMKSLSIRIVDETDSMEKRYFRLKISDALKWIDQRIPEKIIRQLPEHRGRMANLYKDAALELVDYIRNKRNREILHYNHLPFHENPKLIIKYIGMYLNHAELWISQDIDENIADLYPHQSWQSQMDGSWQFFILELPKFFNPDSIYPIYLLFHHENKRKYTRLRELAELLFQNHNLLGKREIHENKIIIRLHSRGNSHDTLGDEELTYIVNWIEKKFPRYARDIRFTGSSKGGREAARAAVRWIDIPSVVDLHGPAMEQPAIFNPILANHSSEYYKLFTNRFLSCKYTNLKNLPLRIVVGENDMRNRKNAIEVVEVAKNSQFVARLEIIPDALHSIPDHSIPALDFEVKPSGKVPNYFEISQTNLRYGKAYGFSALSKSKWWLPFHYSVSVTDFGIEISTRNLNEILLNLDIFSGQQKIDRKIVIDGQAIDVSKESLKSDLILNYKSGFWEKVSHSNKRLKKRPGLQGPIGDIEKEGFVIVYGTLDERAKIRLFNRARQIEESFVGTDKGQWSGGRFLIKADNEVTRDEIEGRNLWIIGNSSENLIHKKFCDEIPLIINNRSVTLGNKTWTGDNLFVELICQNPTNPDHYIFIEAAQNHDGYLAEIFKYRDFDFSITSVDGINNDYVACGILDGEWLLSKNGSKVWSKH